ncbi:MAG: hypothetical protein P1U36_07650 [Legionellaceae bacterium]|nr:hypothetical protein [Legionellaceae bacterium]
MNYLLRIKDYPSIELAFASIPSGTTSLDLSYNSLDWISYITLVRCFVMIPESVISLNLRSNQMGQKKNSELVEIFKVIPRGLISLNLSNNQLNEREDAKLAEVLESIPRGVVSLNLSHNCLGSSFTRWDHSGNRVENNNLVKVFKAIPRSVLSLNLSKNELGLNRGIILEKCFEALPQGVSLLNLSGDYFGRESLVRTFVSIPHSVTTIDLSYNHLIVPSGDELAEFFIGVPAGVTVFLRGNNLFPNETRDQKKLLLTVLSQVNPAITLDFSTHDVHRAMAPLACLSKKPLGDEMIKIPDDIMIDILSFLLPKNTPKDDIQTSFLNAYNIVRERDSINNILRIGQILPFDFFYDYRDIYEDQSVDDIDMIDFFDEEHEVHEPPQHIIEFREEIINDDDIRGSRENEHVGLVSSLFYFICDILSMPSTQVACYALGLVILLSYSSVGMLALGTGLTLFGGVGLAKNTYDVLCVPSDNYEIGAAQARGNNA